MWLGLTLTMSPGCVAPEPAPQEALGGPQEASGLGSDPNALCFRGCLRRERRGAGAKAASQPRANPRRRGCAAWGAREARPIWFALGL